jgi:hypothetical protein
MVLWARADSSGQFGAEVRANTNRRPERLANTNSRLERTVPIYVRPMRLI